MGGKYVDAVVHSGEGRLIWAMPLTCAVHATLRGLVRLSLAVLR